ncbi:MAG: SDR family oxidoreductase [Acidobacteriota bacterium]|nr:SDR family oxidoreductase [Acidobacteriota bacterium]
MSEKIVALVTGANKGLGFETARQLAQKGITVLLGARDKVKGEKAAKKLCDEGLDVRFLPVDVNYQKTHDAAAKFIEEEFGRLDILINNAGIVEDYDVPASAGTLDQWRKTFETNVFNLVALTQTLLPLIKKSQAGRIVNLSSSMGSLKLNREASSSTAYNASKAAVNMFTINLANELKDTPIKVNSADPGWVKTEMGGANALLAVEDGAKTSIALATLPADGDTGKFFHLNDELPW